MRDGDISAQASGEDVPSLLARIEQLERTAAELSAVRETLRQRESQLHQIIDLVPHLIFAKNAEGRFLLVNRAVAESYGTTVKDLTGRSQTEVHHDAEQVESMLADDRQVIQSGHPKFIPAVPFTDYAGIHHTMQVVKIPYVVSGADEQAVLGVAIDITDRMRSEEALRRSKVELESRVLQRTAELAATEERFRQLAENIEEVFWMSTPDKSQMLYVSPAFETVFGSDLQTIYDAPLSFLDVIHPEDRDRVRESLSRQPYGVYSHEYRIVRPDGSLRWIWTRAFPVHNAQGEVYRVAGITQDITDRKLAEERLFSEERTLRKLLAVQDRERKLLAYEIHDGFIQDVVGAQFMLSGLQQQAESEGHESSEMLTQASDALTKALAEGRRLIGELRPLVIDEQGIVEAINYLVHDQHSRGLEIHFEHDLSSKRLNPLLEGNLFRIVQEAVNNIARHSEAQKASISLRESDGLLRLEIRDAGKGFDRGTVPDDRFGLEGMIRRAELFGGHASVDSQPGEGTRVSVEMPIPDQKSD